MSKAQKKPSKQPKYRIVWGGTLSAVMVDPSRAGAVVATVSIDHATGALVAKVGGNGWLPSEKDLVKVRGIVNRLCGVLKLPKKHSVVAPTIMG